MAGYNGVRFDAVLMLELRIFGKVALRGMFLYLISRLARLDPTVDGPYSESGGRRQVRGRSQGDLHLSTAWWIRYTNTVIGLANWN